MINVIKNTHFVIGELFDWFINQSEISIYLFYLNSLDYNLL